MPLISAEEARRQVRGEPADAEELALFTRGAERAVMRFLNRIVYETEAALADGRTAGAARAATANDVWETANSAEYPSAWARDDARRQARVELIRELEEARQMRDGIVINEDIKIAMLLMIGHLFKNREATVAGGMIEMPLGYQHLLWPYRVGLGT